MKKLAILLIGVTLALVSCKKDLDQPDIKHFPDSNVWTVGQLLTALETGEYSFDEDAIVKGYVIADETNGNIYRTIYLRGEDGKCIAMYRPKGDDFVVKVGNHIGFKLYGSILGDYSGLPQIQIQDEDYNSLFVIYDKECPEKVQPRYVTVEEVESGDYLCDLVKLYDMQFMPYANCNFYDPNNTQGNATSRNIYTCDFKKLVVRTSQYASFANDPLPSGNGSITAIATVYKTNYDTTWQLLVRNINDVNMNGDRCGGEGTRENPYTTNDVINLEINDPTTYFWVKDIIVGFVDDDYQYVFSTENSLKSNIVLSSNSDASSADECIPIQLPYGEIRNGLNLADHPENYKQEVLLYGTLETYYQAPGVKNVSYAEINGNSYGTMPGGGFSTIFLEAPLTTQDSYNLFTAFSVTGEQVWTFSSSYGATMSGYANNTSYANEDWFISPAIDLSTSSNPTLTFEHARGPANSINVGVNEGYYTVWVSSDYESGDPNDATWTELTGVVHGTSAWGYVNAGNLSIPAEYHTQNCHFAFKYLSIDGASATWEVKNVILGE